MKKFTLITLFFATIYATQAQDATIWIYRPSKVPYNILGESIKISNQLPFILIPGKVVKYQLHTSGRIVISLNVYGQASAYDEQWLLVEPGKEYFFEIDHKQIQPTRPTEWLKMVQNPNIEEWKRNLEQTLEEDRNFPIKDF
jgi:hypothetical protein